MTQLTFSKDDFEEQLERFDQAWQENPPPAIGDFLPRLDVPAVVGCGRRDLLVELIMIDLECRWQRQLSRVNSALGVSPTGGEPIPDALPEKPLLEDYLNQYPDLRSHADLPIELVGQEYQVRHRWGDRPRHETYVNRFPQLADSLRSALREIDRQRQADAVSPPDAGQIAMADCQPTTEGPGTVVGRFKLLQHIGEGGFGVVYVAEQKEPVKRRVALKILKPGMDTRQIIARFEAERQALAMMDHPNIAKMLDAGQTDSGRPYFVMELVKGVPVTHYCDEQHLTPKERLELFVPICQAVQHAHQKGIIHRDIKPTNILVALSDGQPVPKVIDFGVAKATNQALTEKTMFTQLGQVVGTLEYMSPEQAQVNQLDVDTRSDIYSLGVVLYELLTGDTPFDRMRLRSAAFDEMLRIIREEEPPKPSTKLSSSESLPSVAANRRVEPQKLGTMIRGELDWIVMKAMEKDRARRYETANAFASDISNYLNDEAVLACPPSASYLVRKFTRKHRGLLVTGSIFALLLMFGLFAAGWSMIVSKKNVELVAAETELAMKNSELQHFIADLDRAIEETSRFRRMAEVARDHAAKEGARTRQRSFSEQIEFSAQWRGVCRMILDELAAENAEDRRDSNTIRLMFLNRLADRLDGQYDDQPLIAARLCELIGCEYLSLDAHDAAESQLQRAVELHRSADHTDESEMAKAMLELIEQDRPLAETALLLRQNLDECRTQLGDEHPDTIRAMSDLALKFSNRAKLARKFAEYERAGELFQHSLALYREAENDLHVAGKLYDLAELAMLQKKYDEAQPLYEESLESFRKAEHENNVQLVLARLNTLAALRERTQSPGRADAVRNGN